MLLADFSDEALPSLFTFEPYILSFLGAGVFDNDLLILNFVFIIKFHKKNWNFKFKVIFVIGK
jgi:hypothetical protein